jgi:hypothetical protein
MLGGVSAHLKRKDKRSFQAPPRAPFKKGIIMAHHGFESDANMKQLAKQMGLGATGNFPMGKFNEEDEGEIKIAIAADHQKNKILLNFGKPISWLGLTPDQAIDISNSLRDKAIELKTNSKY